MNKYIRQTPKWDYCGDCEPPEYVAKFILWILDKIMGTERLDRWVSPVDGKGTNSVGPG